MGKLVLTTETLTAASAGTLECDGKVPYFTPQGLERGVVPGMQYYRLNSAFVGANSSTAQSLLGVGVTLSSNTVYQFEGLFPISKSVGINAYTLTVLFGGSATLNSITWTATRTGSPSGFTDISNFNVLGAYFETSTGLLFGSSSTAAVYSTIMIKGTVSIATGGTFIPQYQLSAAPGGAFTTARGASFLIYPIGTAGSNTSVGTWA